MPSASSDAAPQRMTAEEYFVFEEASDAKHEFHAGEVLAMSGATPRHVDVVSRLTRALGNRLDGTPRGPYVADLRIAVESADRYLYPDASVICGPLEFGPSDRNRMAPVNPRVIFEVLSESTELYDRREKFDLYARIPSFEEYVLLAQDEPYAQSFLRQDDGTWNLAQWTGPAAVARVRCLGLELPLVELYPPAPPPPPEG